MAAEIWCRRCNAACRTRKAPVRIVDGVEELADIIHHADGTTERRVWGRVDHASQQIISATLLGE